jgi:hypothetical protein
MKYLISCSLVTLLFIVYCVALYSCTHKVEPDATSIEIGTVENGNEKTTKKIKQSWKWSRD